MSMAATLAALGAGFAAHFADGEVVYTRPSGGMAKLPSFGHALFGAELVAAAQQSTDMITLRKADMVKAGLYPPQPFDRVTIGDRSFSVDRWKTSPATGEPLFVRVYATGRTERQP
jgi:hypothetical protein